MTKVPKLLDMLKAGLHFGHKTSKWHPRMEKYIFTSRNGIHIVDLEKTADGIQRATDFVKDTVSSGKKVLFLGGKPQIKEMVRESAIEAKMPYVVERWLGGTITNFSIISRGIKKYIKLKAQKESGEWDKYVKKERSKLGKQLERLEKKYGGLETVDKIPGAIIVLDAKGENTAITEASIKNVPVVALCDTNVNPDGIEYVIPGNDDSVRGVKLVLDSMVEAVKVGRENASKTKMEEAKK